MKLVIIGGGAHRVLPIARGILALPGALERNIGGAPGEICLCDLNLARAETMGRMLLQTPEQKLSGCRITWTASIDEALPGADVVAVIMPAVSQAFFARAQGPSLQHGFICSDNISPAGALCAVRIAPFILDLARRMERACPRAWLLNFVNPVAVLSGMVNNHTSIRSLGVCAGFTNHLSDIPRLFGEDREATDSELSVQTAGINHLSFIHQGTWQGRDLHAALRERFAPEANWQLPVLRPWWSESSRRNILRSVNRLARFWRELGVVVFSSEGDGMDHLMYDEVVADARASFIEPTDSDIAAQLASQTAVRAEADRTFAARLGENLDDAFWRDHWKTDLRFARADEDIFVRIFAGLAGVREARIATCHPSLGAIAGIKDRHVVEYTQVLHGDNIRPVSPAAEIPDVVHGLVAGFAAHQTLLGDAVAAADPRMVAHALLAYPMNPYGRELRSLYKEMLAIPDGNFPKDAARIQDYL